MKVCGQAPHAPELSQAGHTESACRLAIRRHSFMWSQWRLWPQWRLLPQWRLWPQSRLHLAAVAVSLWGFAAVSLWEKKNVRNAEAAAEAAAEAVAEAAAAAAAAAAVDAIRIEP